MSATQPAELGQLADHVEHFRRRVLQDALNEATAAYWHRRAAAFDAARPRPGDFHGRATRAQLAAADTRLAAQAAACRRAAALALLPTRPDSRPNGRPGGHDSHEASPCCTPERTDHR